MSTGGYIQKDELRESWIFLLLGSDSADESGRDKPTLDYWEIGVANADALVGTTAKRIGHEGVEEESDLVEELLMELQPYRYQGLTVLTPSDATLKELRRRLVAESSQAASLRGFTHISVNHALSKHFDQSLTNYNFGPENRTGPRVTATEPEEVVSSGDVSQFWRCWKQVYRLLPSHAVEGDAL